MDEQDLAIICALHQDPFASYATIGMKLKVSATTVKARADRMRQTGAFSGVAILPEPKLFARHAIGFAFGRFEQDVPDPAWALSFDDVAWASRLYPGVLVVTTYAASPSAPPPPGLVEALGRDPVLVSARSHDARERPDEAVVSPLDWRVVDALLAAPRASLTELAQMTALSPRTVRARRDRLLAEGLLRPHPLMDVAREPGIIVFSVFARFASSEALARLRPGSLSTTLIASHDVPPAAFLLGHAGTYAEAMEIEARFRRLDGVVEAHLAIPQGSAVATERLRRWAQDEIARWTAARRRGA